jgi:FkbM family methyltransferase
MNIPKNFGENESRTEEYLKKFSRQKTLEYLISDKQPIIFDIGANNGSSLYEFRGWWPSSDVHCFEPQKECWPDLEKLAEDPNNLGNTYIHKFAVGSINSERENFYTHDLNTGISGLHKLNIDSKDSVLLNDLRGDDIRLDAYSKTINHQRLVPVRRLDTFLEEQQGLDKIHLMKLDVQGHEVEVLKGMGDKLSNVAVILTELNFYDLYEKNLSFLELESILAPSGFAFYDISHISKNPLNGRTDWIDVIYVNTKLLDTANLT